MIYVKYREVELKCEFKMDSYEEATMYQPEEGGDIEDLTVYIQDIDVTDIFSEKQIEEIMDLIYEKL
jgi:hypothetical protein